jgi:hypothetical protein
VLKLTARPELAVAVTDPVAPTPTLAATSNTIVWLPWPIAKVWFALPAL